jgi:hypothetical protein
MTVRTKTIGGVLVYAGSREELAAIADGYARGERERPEGYSADLFRRVAAELRTGHPVHNLGPIRFYSDRADGAPFRGPLAPDPDPAWLARQQAHART